MLSGSRHCLRRRAVSSFIDKYATAPDEPLLFLYPRWFSTTVNTPSTRTSRAVTSEEDSDRALGNESSAGGSGGSSANGHGQQWQSPETAARISLSGSRPHQPPSKGGTSTLEGAKPKDRSDLLLESSSPKKNPQPEPIQSNKESNIPSNTSPTTTELASTSSNASVTRRDTSSEESNPQKSTNPPIRRMISSELRNENQWKADKQKRYTKYLNFIQRQRENSHLYYVATLEKLSRAANDSIEPAISKGQKAIYLPEKALIPLVGRLDENIWGSYGRSGCQVHVLGPDHSNGRNRKVILSGSPRSIELAEEDIAQVLAKKDKTPLVRLIQCRTVATERTIEKGIECDHKLRVQVPGYEPPLLRTDKTRVDEIPRPEVWTIRSFADYVEEVTDLTIYRSMHRNLYQQGEMHVFVVRDLLYELFSNPANEAFISTRALNLVMKFFYRHRFIPSARSLFAKFTSMLTTDSFNIMLQAIAKDGNIHHFNYFLELMEGFDIRANGMSWVALVKAITYPRVRNRAIRVMRSKKLLDDPTTLRALVAVIVSDDFLAHLDSKQDVPAFIELMDRRYGLNWPSTPSLNQMISVAATKGDWEGITKIGNLSGSRHVNLTSGSLNRSLRYFHNWGDMRGAMKAFFHFTHLHSVSPDAETIEVLFVTARKQKKYNLCRVLWRYACLYGTLSFRSQDRVLTSLLRNNEGGKWDRWDITFGKVVAGMDADPSSLGSDFDLLKQTTPAASHKNAMAYLVGFRPLGPERSQQRGLASLMVARDLEAVKRFTPVKSLYEMLEKAEARDKKWEGREEDMSVHWMIDNAVRVPIQKKVQSIPQPRPDPFHKYIFRKAGLDII